MLRRREILLQSLSGNGINTPEPFLAPALPERQRLLVQTQFSATPTAEEG